MSLAAIKIPLQSMSAFTTRFQTTAEVISALETRLNVIQQQASVPETPLHGNMEARTCAIIFRTIVVDLREKIAPDACASATYLLNNVLSTLAQDRVTKEEKILKIRKFLDSSSFNDGSRGVLPVWDQLHRLSEWLNASSDILSQMGFNPQSILNQFDTVNMGIVSLKNFYMQIQTDLEDFINQLAGGESQIRGLEHATRWLTAISADLTGFAHCST